MLKQNIPLEEVLVKFSKEYDQYAESTKDVHVKLLEQIYSNLDQKCPESADLKADEEPP